MKSLLATIMAAALCLGAAWPAAAQERSNPTAQKVILVSTKSCCPAEAWVEAEKKIEAELGDVNFSVEVVNGGVSGVGAGRIELGILAGEKKAVCALRIVKSADGRGGEADLWINNPVSGKTSHKRVLPEGKDGDGDASIFALRVVEVLRAGLLDLKLLDDSLRKLGRQTEGEENAPQPLQTPKEPANAGGPGPLSVHFGAGAVGFPNDAGFLGTASIALRGTFIPALSVELGGTTSFPGKRVGTPAAGSTFSVTMVRAWAMWEMLQAGLLRPAIGAGGGIVVAKAEGADSVRFTGASDATSTGYLGVNAQCAVAAWEYVWFRVGAGYGRSVPEVLVRFGGAGAGTFGKPLLEGSAGVEVKVP
ncbi:MAG: hypothetical protein HY897_23405 [Deltaproteobacteria bacterium]|nr:hypothetical protein [Deltaproteobacteria bacterium]